MKYSFIKWLLSFVLLFLFLNYIVKTVVILGIVISVIWSVLNAMFSSNTSENPLVEEDWLSIRETPTIDNVDLTDDATPSVFVDEKLLKVSTFASCCEYTDDIFKKGYRIHDDIFVGNTESFNNGNELIEFELEPVESDDDCCDDDDKQTFIQITCRRVESGSIINSHVFLSVLQWNTILELSDDLLNCIVCDMYFEPLGLDEHIKMEGHSIQLSKYQPISKYKSSITRKIGDVFHCGVCNQVYLVSEENYHNNNVSHKDNVLTSINRARDTVTESNESNVDNDCDDVGYFNDEILKNGEAHGIAQNDGVKTPVRAAMPKRDDIIKLSSNSVEAPKTESSQHSDTDVEDGSSGTGPRARSAAGRKLPSYKTKKKLNSETSSDISSINDSFMNENVQIVIKKSHFVIDQFAYHTIVFYGYVKYCFVCDVQIVNEAVDAHVNDNAHAANMNKHHFLDNYSKYLIRQNNHKYHCGVCNVVVNQTHLQEHIEWATHQKLSIQCKTMKSARRTKSKAINVATAREEKPAGVNAPRDKIIMHVQIIASPTHPTDRVFYGRYFNIDFNSWNGICKLDNGFKCILCKGTVTEDAEKHCHDRHSEALLNNIDERYFPALIRKIDDEHVHCIACNKLLFTEHKIITEHTNAKRHYRNHNKLIRD